jgi:hypothetical protein
VAFVDAIKKLDIALQTGVFPLDHPLAILSSGERGLEEGKYHLARSTWQEGTNSKERYVLREQRRSATRAFFGFGHCWPGPGPIITEAVLNRYSGAKQVFTEGIAVDKDAAAIDDALLKPLSNGEYAVGMRLQPVA